MIFLQKSENKLLFPGAQVQQKYLDSLYKPEVTELSNVDIDSCFVFYSLDPIRVL